MGTRENLQLILDAPGAGLGLDIVVVSTTTRAQAGFWERRLKAGRGQICRADALILTVVEDWPGGAGNGLGTLYALLGAAESARRAHGRDLMAELAAGASVGIYHTAGKGTRLAPLPGSEGNNKPAVKLTGAVTIDGRTEAMTILEAVIRQTAIYAAGRAGRVGVFWGDQVFIPSAGPPSAATHHVDILATLGPMPDDAEWDRRSLERYGLIAVAVNGDAAQVEKVSHSVAAALIRDGVIAVDGGIGVSLGSFSMSATMAVALIDEFSAELESRTTKLDTDPHFWMPLTLDAATYGSMMTAKSVEASVADAHFTRMSDFLDRFQSAHPDRPIFGCVDVGDAGWWWDYGTIEGYVANNLKLLGGDEEAAGMRDFFGVAINGGNILVDSEISRLTARGCVMVGVLADQVSGTGSVLVSVQCPVVQGNDLLLYNVSEAGDIILPPGSIRADVLLPGDGPVALLSHRGRDGKDDWDLRLPGNPMSWAELHACNDAAEKEES